MSKYYKSIIDNVVFLDIDTSGLHEDRSIIKEIAIIKIVDESIIEYKRSIKNKENAVGDKAIEEVNKEIKNFIEDKRIIGHDGEFIKKFMNYHFPDIKNEFLDVMELASILEPWRKDYSLDILFVDIINNKFKGIDLIDNCYKTLMVVNALLCRLWYYEEFNKSKKKMSLYNILIRDYSLEEIWGWTKYLEKPLFFNYDEFSYVLYERNKKVNLDFSKIKIKYSDFEDLLKQNEIWNNGNDFNYEYRESQKEFSSSIRLNIENEEKIFIEAPTGSGKTFAYLLIIVLEALINKKKNRRENASYIISTDTKELQNQLIDRDIPNLLNKLNLTEEIKYGAMKGKSNYICTDKLRVYKPFNEGLKKTLGEIFLKRLCKDGEYGDIENISYYALNHFNLDEVFNEVVCDSEECNLDKCFRVCYLKKRYNELPSENITVINHSLLASWPYGETKKITHLIIDEAHNLMEKCYDFFSDEFNTFEFKNLINQVLQEEPTIYRQLINLNSNNGLVENIEKDKIEYWCIEMQKSIDKVLSMSNALNLVKDEYNFRCEYNLVNEELKESLGKISPLLYLLKENIRGFYALISRYLGNIAESNEMSKEDKEYINIVRFLSKIKDNYDSIEKFLEVSKDKNNYAKAIEIHNDYSNFKLTNIPLNIDELFNEIILKEVKSTTFLSATMRINNSFGEIKGLLGQRDANELVVRPTFDLRNRTKIFSVNDVGRYNNREFIEKTAYFIFELCKKTRGHMLVLFTNNKRLKAVEEKIRLLTKGSKIEVYTSKKAIRYLSDRERNIIVLGSKSFFEGIDVPGDGLTTVVLDKLPNKNIEDPLLKALKEYKRRSYRDINYPQLCIKTKQIYGRIIRSKLDYGYFCILDSGNNENTINQLERDLGGPSILSKSRNEIIKSIEEDYEYWSKENLRHLIKTVESNKVNLEDYFDIEARKRNSYWKLIKDDSGKYYFENLFSKYK